MTIEEKLAENVAEFMEHGAGLRPTTRVWISGRDRTNGYVYLSGLGGMGVGDMWAKETEEHATYTGFDDAPDCVTTEGRGMLGGRDWVSGDWPAIFARTAMGMMARPRSADAD